MESDYGQAYADLYRRHWWWRAREEFLLRLFQSLELPPRPSVLDIGCGDGLFFERLLELGGTVEGLESADALLSAEARQRYAIHIGPFDESYSPHKTYALVLMLDVLEHLPNPLAALRQASGLLEPGGRLVVTVPAFMGLWTQHDQLNHHQTRYTRATLAALVAQSSLRILQLRYFFHWLAPLKLATRWKERGLARCGLNSSPTPPRVPGALVNRSLLELSRWEQRLWGRFQLPLGSSLLMVCDRGTEVAKPAW
jgi:SAM-dependent methyltransferase